MWKEGHFARWKPDRRTLSSTCSCDGIWREFCWLHSSSPSAVSTTRPAPWCPRRRPITKNSPVLLPGWTSRILRPYKVSCTSSSSRESRPDRDVVLLRLPGPFAALMSRNACNGENGETGKKSPAAGDLNWMPKVAELSAISSIFAKYAIFAEIATFQRAPLPSHLNFCLQFGDFGD